MPDKFPATEMSQQHRYALRVLLEVKLLPTSFGIRCAAQTSLKRFGDTCSLLTCVMPFFPTFLISIKIPLDVVLAQETE